MIRIKVTARLKSKRQNMRHVFWKIIVITIVKKRSVRAKGATGDDFVSKLQSIANHKPHPIMGVVLIVEITVGLWAEPCAFVLQMRNLR